MIKITAGIMIGATLVLSVAQISGVPAKLGHYDSMRLEYLELSAYKKDMETRRNPISTCRGYYPDPPIRQYYTDKQADKQLKSPL